MDIAIVMLATVVFLDICFCYYGLFYPLMMYMYGCRLRLVLFRQYMSDIKQDH